MGVGRDALYATAALLGAPVWVPFALRKGLHRTSWRDRFGAVSVGDPTSGPRVLLHAVSVGEVSSIVGLVPELAAAGFEVVISSTTDTGIARARALYGEEVAVVPFPFDWSSSVRKFLDNVNPDVVALVELEIWPNFVERCVARDVPVVVVGGRISDRSAPRYRRLGPLLHDAYSSLDAVGAQTQTYADRFVALGTPKDRVTVTNSLKWDAVEIGGARPEGEALARDMGIDLTRPLVVAGSTGPGEELTLVRDWPPDVQLLIAPRKPERFDEVARLVPTAVRRSRVAEPSFSSAEAPNLFLLDSIGELQIAYSLANVAIIGRSFNGMGGSNPIEAVASGCATLIGPDYHNFDDVVRALRANGGLQVCAATQIAQAAAALARDADASREMAQNARDVILRSQGATRRTVQLIERVLAGPASA